VLNELATDRPVKHFPHEGEGAVSLDQSTTLHELIQERNDITAANIVCFTCPHSGSTSLLKSRASSRQLFLWTLA
jgi:hypothetical protein